jgi:osmotically-inducible protein OsmY
MSTNTALHERVIAVLRDQLGQSEPHVTVAVSDGVVTLTGCVQTAGQKLSAERAVAQIPGVCAVAGGVHVAGDAGRNASDTAIAHAVVDAMRVEPDTDLSTVAIRVEKGWVTLTGRVHSMLAFDAVDRALECISVDAAVRGITSEIQLDAGSPSCCCATTPRVEGASHAPVS